MAYKDSDWYTSATARNMATGGSEFGGWNRSSSSSKSSSTKSTSSSSSSSSRSSSSSGGGGGSSSRSYNFVDPSVLHDVQVNWLSRSEVDAKRWTGTANNVDSYDNTYYAGSWTNSWNIWSTYKATWSFSWSASSASSASSANKTMNTMATSPLMTNMSMWNGNRYVYNPVTMMYEKGNKANNWMTYQEDKDYYGTLYDKDKFSPNATYSWDTQWDNTRGWLTDPTQQYNNNQTPNTNVNLAGWNMNVNMNRFDSVVDNKLRTAFWIENLDALADKYPDQYESLIQWLNSVSRTWNSLDPSQRQMLDGQLQAIIWTAVGAWSDKSKLDVLNESITNKFENWDQVAKDMQNIVRLQTEWLSTSQIARQMWISEDQVQQSILAVNWLDNRLWEYYKLKDSEASEITEDFDKKMERMEQEKEIALERANRQLEWLKEDFNKNYERQKKANEINEHNADFMSGQYWFWFSKRGIEWMNYVTEQAKQIIDDMVTNYDRSKVEIADGISDIIRNWEWNNEDLLKASEDALTMAKNNYTSNMLAIQQQYGTVWMQAQQQMANNVQSFISQAESIYDNALARQQQNLSNLITNFSNLNALQYSNLTLRNAKIQQFQSEAMTMNRSQLQQLATQLWMSSQEYGDLANYQIQAVANELNGYAPWAWIQMQGQIQSLLNQWYTPQQALAQIMNSQEFKNITASNGEWSKLNDNIIFDKNTGQYMEIWTGVWWMSWANGANYVSSETVGGQTYGVSQDTYNGLVNFYSSHQIGSNGGQCWKFVNDYLQSLGLWRIFTDPIKDKKAQINTPQWYKPQVWDVVVMDSPTKSQYGHVAIITWVNADWSFTTLESNKWWEWQVFSRTINPSKTKVYGYYHPDGATEVSQYWEWEYDLSLSSYFENWFKISKDDRANTLKEYGITQKEFNRQYNAYFEDKEQTEALENITKLRDTAQQLLEWNKKHRWLHEWKLDLQTYKEWSFKRWPRWIFQWQTKASEWIAMYNFLKNNQSLDKFLEAKKNGWTFGSMSNAEWQLIWWAASLLNWETNDKNFEKQLQNMIDEYNKALNKMWWNTRFTWTVDLSQYWR